MAETAHDLLVIGAGPGGYVAAIRAAQLGMKVGIIEKEESLGGTCLRVGCIPSKALLESSEKYAALKSGLGEHGIQTDNIMLDLQAMLQRKTGIINDLGKGIVALLKKNKITRYSGSGSLTGGGAVTVTNADESTTLTAKHILIATGSESTSLPGIEFAADCIGTSTEALSYNDVPNHLVVIGAGVIGLELGSVWLRLGARVTVLEYCDHILPGMDKEIGKEAQKLLKRQGFNFQLSSKVTAARKDGDGAVVEIEGAEPIHCDRVLVAVGRRAYTTDLGLETLGIETDKAGRIPVDENFQTSVAGVYAIGDVIAGAMLAHKAEEEGVACVEKIATGYGHVDYNCIPGVVYTHPEIACVGRSEEALVEAGVPYKKGTFPYRGNGRARTLGSVDGKAKILAHAETDRVLGVHIIGERAGDLIAEAAVAMAYHASSEDLARVCHAHPSLSEIIKETALAVDKRAIHA